MGEAGRTRADSGLGLREEWRVVVFQPVLMKYHAASFCERVRVCTPALAVVEIQLPVPPTLAVEASKPILLPS